MTRQELLERAMRRIVAMASDDLADTMATKTDLRATLQDIIAEIAQAQTAKTTEPACSTA